MSVSISWYDDSKRVILQRYEGKWTWEDLNHASQETRNLGDSVPYNVILFIDTSPSNQMHIPQGNVLSHGRAAFNLMPTNLTHIIIVIKSQIFEVFCEVIINMLPQWRNRVKFIKTVEEGQRLVADAMAENLAKSASN